MTQRYRPTPKRQHHVHLAGRAEPSMNTPNMRTHCCSRDYKLQGHLQIGQSPADAQHYLLFSRRKGFRPAEFTDEFRRGHTSQLPDRRIAIPLFIQSDARTDYAALYQPSGGFRVLSRPTATRD